MIQVLTDVQALESRRTIMIEYLKMKLNEADWHAVCDAGMDLREIEVLLAYHRQQEKFNLNKAIAVGQSTIAVGQSGGQIFKSVTDASG